MARRAAIFSAGTRQAFSVAIARDSISARTPNRRDFSSAKSGRDGASKLRSLRCALVAISISLKYSVIGAGLDAGRALRCSRARKAIGRVLVDQRLDRIVHVHGLRLADEDRVGAVGDGGDLAAEDVDLRVGKISDAIGGN